MKCSNKLMHASGAIYSSSIASQVESKIQKFVFSASLMILNIEKIRCVEKSGKISSCALGKDIKQQFPIFE